MGQFDFSQNNPQWLDTPLGFSTYYYIGTHNGSHDVAAGCYVTSLAMSASYLGHPILPPGMNDLLKNANLIDNQGDITVNDTLNRLYPDIQFIERVDWPTQPAPLDYFDVMNDLNTEIIVLIDDSPASGLQQHWLRVVGYDGGSDIIVVDPWDGVRKGLSAYANRSGTTVPKIIYAAVKYRKSSPASTVPVPTPDVPVPSVPVAPVQSSDPVISTSPLPVDPPEAATPAPGAGDNSNAGQQSSEAVPPPAAVITSASSDASLGFFAWLWSLLLGFVTGKGKKKL